MVKTVAVGVGRTFVGALKALGFVVWYMPQIAFLAAIVCMTNVCVLPFSIRLFGHFDDLRKKDKKPKHRVFIGASWISWVAMVVSLFVSVTLFWSDANFRNEVSSFLSAGFLPIPFTELGISLRYILYTLLATNLVSFFYEIGRLGKKSDVEAKPDESEKTEQDGDQLGNFLDLLD